MGCLIEWSPTDDNKLSANIVLLVCLPPSLPSLLFPYTDTGLTRFKNPKDKAMELFKARVSYRVLLLFFAVACFGL